MFHRLSLVFVVVVAACGVEPWPVGSVARPVVVGSTDITLVEDWKVAVHQSLLFWSVTLGNDCPLPVRIAEGDEPGCEVRLVPVNRWGHGSATGVEDDCYIEIRGSEAWGHRLILEHEFGHAFGFEHNDDPKSVMHSDVGEEITTEDIEIARSSFGCDP